MKVRYKLNAKVAPGALRGLFEAAGLKRPSDARRLAKMLREANLTVTAWDGDKLVGVARALTDFSWCCYVADLAVHADYQRKGIGRELMRRVRAELNDGVMVLLLENQQTAKGYYAKIGFEKVESAMRIRRKY